MKKFNVTVNGSKYEVEVEEVGGSSVSAAPAAPIASAAALAPAPAAAPAAPAASGSAGSVKLEAPMPGTVLKISVKPGDAVKKGETVLVLEAMKMENEIAAPADGVVASVNVAQGTSVNTGDLLATLQ